MIDKSIIRKEQLAYLDQICTLHNLTLTEIARTADVASTTLTRFHNGDPKHVLSATTLAKIKAKYRVERESPIFNANDNRADSELAVAYTLQIILKLLVSKKMAKPEWLEENFNRGLNHYRKHRLPNAALLMEQMLSFLADQAHQKGKSPSRQSLELAPLEAM